jgi:hypothetical protein
MSYGYGGNSNFFVDGYNDSFDTRIVATMVEEEETVEAELDTTY